MLEDFYSPEEVDEMLRAGRGLCAQAPKEERKVFSTTDPELSQVSKNLSDIEFFELYLNFLFLESR